MPLEQTGPSAKTLDEIKAHPAQAEDEDFGALSKYEKTKLLNNLFTLIPGEKRDKTTAFMQDGLEAVREAELPVFAELEEEFQTRMRAIGDIETYLKGKTDIPDEWFGESGLFFLFKLYQYLRGKGYSHERLTA